MIWTNFQAGQFEPDRRTFSKISLGALGGLLLDWKSLGQQASTPPQPLPFFGNFADVSPGDNEKSHTIQYLQATAPEFQIPAYDGHRYQDTVPDTLDIAERAKLAIHVLTAITDPRSEYEIYWLVDFARNPPTMRRDFSDWVVNCEGFMEALPLLRTATGSSLNEQVDPVWMKALLRSIGSDGLVYIPMKGRPWILRSVALGYVEPVWTPDGKKIPVNDPSVDQLGCAMACERILGTMTVYYLRDRSPMWKASIEKMIQRLSAIAVSQEDYAYLPAGSVLPNANFGPSPMPSGAMAEELSGRPIQGLMQYYKVTGYEPARDLARKLTRYVKFHSRYYDAEGRPLVGVDEELWFKVFNIAGQTYGGHGHSHAIGILGIAEYAAVVNDRESLAFARNCYEWYKAHGCSRVGFFPEIFAPDYERCESCTIADMIGTALKLTLAGAGDYWDDADRWARNHFSESQMTDPAWVHKLAERSAAKPVQPNETADRVPERNVGAFAGWSMLNDWVSPSPYRSNSIQHCCSGNSSRALYYLWENILDFRQGSLTVNLLLNRASAWCDLHSYLPYEGRVDLKFKKASERTRVRVPEWTSDGSPEVTCKANGSLRPVKWQGRYVDVGEAGPGDVITLQFPIPEHSAQETVGKTTYRLLIRGNTVISIDPPGRNGPLYERAYYRQPVRWRKVERFVPDHPIAW